MNRRDFIRNAATALFGFTVLPPATTYSRVWRAIKPMPVLWRIDWTEMTMTRARSAAEQEAIETALCIKWRGKLYYEENV